MTINDGNSKQPQRRFQRHGRSRNSPLAQPSSSQAQLASDTQEENIGVANALFDSSTNTSITGGQFTAGSSVNRTVTINIGEGVTSQAQSENYHSRQTPNRSRNRRRGQMRPQQDPTGPVQRSNEIYERHLRQKKRGHPLYIPQSNMALPIPYRAQGVRVGDVGIFTEDGAFDFLFNICVSRDDPINPAELPVNFVPIPSICPTDIRKFAQFSPGSYLASSSGAECRTTEQSSGLTFESSASEGAILTMPEGAYSEDLSNSSRLSQYIAIHAEDWYKFVNGPRGREAQNGGLHVVAGCDKTTSWGMATFSNSSLSQDTNFRLKFSASGEPPSHRNAGDKYTWEHSGVAEVRVGPGRGENEELGETDSNRLRNQCLFLRTLNVTLSEKVWGEIFPQTVDVPDQKNSHSGIQNQSMHCLHGSCTGNSYSQSSQSNSSQDLPYRGYNSAASSTTDLTMEPPNLMELPSLNSSSYDIFDGLPGFPLSLHEEIKPSFGSGPFINSFTDEFRQDVIGSTSQMKCVVLPSQPDEEETSSQLSSSISPKLIGYEEFECDSAPRPDVILTPSSSCNRVLHPSKIINQYLLEQVPHARVAVTHDRDWSGIIGMDSCHSDPAHLLSVVLSMNDIVLEDDTGLVFLELKEKNPNSTLLEESIIAGLAESIRDGRLTLDQYLFGIHGDRCRHLQDLCDALRSGSTNQPIPMSLFLTGHPERPLSLDEICNGDFDVKDSTQRQSIVSLRAELSSLSSQPADRSSCLLRLADALSRRYSQWYQRDDLEEAIWSYEEALSHVPKFHYQYLETLLGLCSSLYQRFYHLGHADDFKSLLRYLELQYEVLDRRRSLLAPVEARLKKFRKVSGSTEGLESGLSVGLEDRGSHFYYYFDGFSDAFTASNLTMSNSVYNHKTQRADPDQHSEMSPADQKESRNWSKLPRACARCKKFKVKCEAKTETDPCKRCLNGGHDCVIPERKIRRTPPKREDLLSQIQSHAQAIEMLMQQLAEITAPSASGYQEPLLDIGGAAMPQSYLMHQSYEESDSTDDDELSDVFKESGDSDDRYEVEVEEPNSDDIGSEGRGKHRVHMRHRPLASRFSTAGTGSKYRKRRYALTEDSTDIAKSISPQVPQQKALTAANRAINGGYITTSEAVSRERSKPAVLPSESPLRLFSNSSLKNPRTKAGNTLRFPCYPSFNGALVNSDSFAIARYTGSQDDKPLNCSEWWDGLLYKGGPGVASDLNKEVVTEEDELKAHEKRFAILEQTNMREPPSISQRIRCTHPLRSVTPNSWPAQVSISRASSNRSNKDRPVATLAYQPTLYVPDSHDHIEAATKRDTAIFKKGIQARGTLLIQLFRSALIQATPFPELIIIDGLDECKDSRAQVSILNALEILVKRSSGQFIRAPEVVRFDESNHHEHQLTAHPNITLGNSPSGAMDPFAGLDILYNHILSCVDGIQATANMVDDICRSSRRHNFPGDQIVFRPNRVYVSWVDLFVRPGNRRRGYGTILLATAVDADQDIDIINGYSWHNRVLKVRLDRQLQEFGTVGPILQNCPPFTFPAQSSSQMSSGPYASLPRLPVLYDQVYNDDLMYIKVHLLDMLRNNRLSNMPMGYPFYVVHAHGRRSHIPHGSYNFEERFPPSGQTATFSYVAPPLNFEVRQRMSWRISVPSRETSVNGMIPSNISIAQVEVDPKVMETSYGVTFMTDPRVLLENLSLSIELGVLITVTVASCKTPMLHPTDRNLDYCPGDIIFIATDNNHQSEVVFVFKTQLIGR